MADLPTLNLRQLEQEAIRFALERSGGDVRDAAKLLGIGRSTLYRRLGKMREQEQLARVRAWRSA